jgi:hypothetical protein
VCGKEAIRTGPMQKYCDVCSEIKDLERKKLWARNNPLPEEVWKEKRTKQTLKEIGRGKENQLKSNSLLYEKEVDSCNFNHAIIVSVPFSYGYSKNAIYSMTSHGHVYLRQQTRELRDKLYGEILEAINGGKQFYKAKIYLDILVEKPNHKGDAVNVVDTVCDAVKDAIKVDDRWFAIRSLDWRIVKEDGKLIVGIYQEAECDHVVCHRCGNFYPKEEMQRRVCKYCASAKNIKEVNKETSGVMVYIDTEVK